MSPPAPALDVPDVMLTLPVVDVAVPVDNWIRPLTPEMPSGVVTVTAPLDVSEL
jgi:hypothetical protein